MASKIIATGAGFTYAPDTTGALELQVASGTTAIAFSTAGAMGVGATPSYGSSGQVLTSTGTGSAPQWSNTGSVTSIAATVPSVFSITGSPITSSGTLAITYSGNALPNTSGGTGQTSAFNQYGITYASSTTALSTTAAGTAGHVLTSNGTSAPTFQPPGLTAGKSIAFAIVMGF